MVSSVFLLSALSLGVPFTDGAVREVHPADKEPVGRRLARLVLRHDYGVVDDAKFKGK